VAHNARETDHGGVAYIVIADNGCGVSPEEAGFAAENAVKLKAATAGIFTFGCSKYKRSSAEVDLVFSGELSFFGKGMRLTAVDKTVHSFRFITRAPIGTLQEFEQDHGKCEILQCATSVYS
jgi:hypothetical protein